MSWLKKLFPTDPPKKQIFNQTPLPLPEQKAPPLPPENNLAQQIIQYAEEQILNQKLDDLRIAYGEILTMLEDRNILQLIDREKILENWLHPSACLLMIFTL